MNLKAVLTRRRRVFIAAAIGLGCALLAAFVLAGSGRYETFPAPIGPRNALAPPGAPAWSAPCWRHALRSAPMRPANHCALLEGRVVFKRTEKAEHGGDHHFVVVARRHLRYFKIIPRDRVAGRPGIGHRVRVVGSVNRGAHVDEQIRAWSVEDEGF